LSCYFQEGNINQDLNDVDLRQPNSNQAELSDNLQQNNCGKADLEKSRDYKSDFTQKDIQSELFKSNTEFDANTELQKVNERERYESPSSPPKTGKNYSNMKK